MIEDVMQFQFIEFVDDHQAFKNLYYFLINFLLKKDFYSDLFQKLSYFY